MKQLQSVDSVRTFVRQQKALGKSIGFVPTMGGLHEGHLSLVKESRKYCDITIVSIFVNPAQFGPNEDFASYPRTLEDDLALLPPLGVSSVFLPTTDIIYPTGPENATQVNVPRLSKPLCGKSRPRFFKGITTVVSRLFRITEPDYAFFGEKDFQQLILVRQMSKDLFLDVTVIGCPIIREADGLAMSSRNRYLSPTERQQAPKLYEGMNRLKNQFDQGERQVSTLLADLHTFLTQHIPINIDYLAIKNSATLKDRKIAKPGDRLFVAGMLGSTRLIDNIEL